VRRGDARVISRAIIGLREASRDDRTGRIPGYGDDQCSHNRSCDVE
jgi:hypothetical protein